MAKPELKSSGQSFCEARQSPRSGRIAWYLRKQRTAAEHCRERLSKDGAERRSHYAKAEHDDKKEVESDVHEA